MQKVKFFLVNLLVGLGLLALIFFILRVIPHPPLNQNLMLSSAYYDKNGELLRLNLSKDEAYRIWTPLEEISPYVINGVLLHEDQWFYYHAGFNPISLVRGGWISYVKKGNMQGGSTITMQLARMYWKLNTRSVKGKFLQVLRAIQLELFYSKDDILEAYFNYAPYGRNIESIGAASKIYFDKEPKDLTLPEALTLAVLPQSPSYRINKKTGLVGEGLTKARNSLFEKWKMKYDVDSITNALFSLPLKLRQPEQLPFISPHFVEQTMLEDYVKGKFNARVDTTIDIKMQTLLETQIKSYIDTNKIKNVNNAAAILVDMKDMSVVAQVGSANYFNNDIQGMINGANIKRSPGSTLKPFIYALAMDQGLMHPLSVLKDVPSSFGTYEPENFDYNFIGPITATQALISSRNIPAVYTAAKLKNPSFYQFLKNAGISKMEKEGHYGLALVLGGGDVTLKELASLYTILGNKGELYNIRTRINEPLNDGVRLLSAEASFLTLEMLSKNPQTGASYSQKQGLPIYWKTGTSWGFRDAWSVGIVGNYVLVVWLGNFDNTGNPAFVGANSAASLFFNIANSLQASIKNLTDINKVVPKGVSIVDICLPSGDLNTIWCKRKGKTWFIPGVSPIKVDTVYRPVVINKKTNLPLCDGEVANNTKVEVYEYYSTDILEIFEKAGLPKRAVPDTRHCINGLAETIGINPSITSPLRGAVYTIRAETMDKERISFSATTDAEVELVYWFIDEEYIGKSTPKNSLVWLPKKSGEFLVSVIDDHGRVDKQKLSVNIMK